jgi:hypothetical protein
MVKNKVFKNSLILFFIFCIVYIAAAFLFSRQPQGPSGGTRGDEPHFLIISYSLWEDKDLDLTNNYQNKDWLKFHPTAELDPHVGKGEQGQMYPIHGALLSVFILPFYFLAGVLGVRIFLGVLAALLVANVFLFCYETTKKKNLSLLVASVLGLSVPLLTNSIFIFPEILAGLIVLWVVRKLSLTSQSNFVVLAVGTCLGLLFWLHVKYLILVFILAIFALYYFYKQRVKKERYICFLTPLLLLGFGLMFYLYHFYGSVLPNAAYQSIGHPTLFSGNLLTGILGALFDQERGLLINAPVYILTIFGALFLWKKSKQLVILLSAIILPYFILICSFRDWMGGWSPAARYLVPIVGLASPFIVECIVRLKRLILFRFLTYLFVFWGLILVLLIPFTLHFGYGDWLGENEALQVIRQNTGINLAYLFPSFINISLKSYLLSVIFIMMIILLSIYFYQIGSKPLKIRN